MKNFINFVYEMKIDSDEFKNFTLGKYEEKYKEIMARNKNIDFNENKIIKQGSKILVGYWAGHDGVLYGKPVSNWKGWENEELYNTFLKKFKNKLEKSKMSTYWGWTNCRLCGIKNGDSEYVFDNKYIVPEGYIHYITKHKITPHKWFLEYIINS
jgi:hypothetical protein